MTSTVPHSPPARDEWVGWVLVSVQLSLLGTLCAEALRRCPQAVLIGIVENN